MSETTTKTTTTTADTTAETPPTAAVVTPDLAPVVVPDKPFVDPNPAPKNTTPTDHTQAFAKIARLAAESIEANTPVAGKKGAK